MKKVYLYTGIFILLIITLFIIESSIPTPVDWDMSFNETHKKPWGTLIINSEIKTIFPEAEIENVIETPFEKLDQADDYQNSTYIIIDFVTEIDDESIDELLDFAYDGNKVFISASRFPYELLESLDLDIEIIEPEYPENDTLVATVGLYNKRFKTNYDFTLGFMPVGFKDWDNETSQALGYQTVDGIEYVNYIKIEYGDGSFYLHTQPFAFTNYHMLKNDHADYATGVLSYLDNDKILWNCKQKDGFAGNTSPLRFILSNPSLSFAWRLGLAGILIFVFFMARRRQRIVPVIEKLPNTSVDFVKTIGNLYFQEGQTKDIVTKKITFFLEKVRNTFLIDTSILNDDFKKRLEQKSGVAYKDINKLVNFIIFLNEKDEIDEEHLITLNKLIDIFNRKTIYRKK